MVHVMPLGNLKAFKKNDYFTWFKTEMCFGWRISVNYFFFADMKAQTKVSLLFCKSNTDLKHH